MSFFGGASFGGGGGDARHRFVQQLSPITESPPGATTGQECFVMGNGHKGSVASLAWSPTVDNPQEAMVACTDWDGDATVIKVQFQQNAQGKFGVAAAALACPALSMQVGPLLCASWSNDHKIALGGGDGQLRLWELAKGNGADSVSVLGTHEAGIKAVLPLDAAAGWGASGFLTGSWDASVALWDPRAPAGQPAGRWRVGCRVFGLDGCAPYLLVAGSDRRILVYDVRRPGEPVDLPAAYSPCRAQTRAACFIPAAQAGAAPKGFAAGSVDGHVGACLFSPAQPQGGGPQQRAVPQAAPPGGGVHSVNAVSVVPPAPGQEARYLFAAAANGLFAVYDLSEQPAAGASFWRDGTPIFRSEAAADPSMPPPTNPALQPQLTNGIACASWLRRQLGASGFSVVAYANSNDGTGGPEDYMAQAAAVAHKHNVVRFWVPPL